MGSRDGRGAELIPLVYDELRRLAARYLGGRSGETLQPTAIVHEAYVRLAGGDVRRWATRAEFLAAAAVAMRHVLVDHVRAKRAAKRGGAARKVTLDESFVSDPGRKPEPIDLLDLTDALDRLAAAHARPARIVELRYFGGMTSREIASVVHVSTRTVESDLALARAWLAARLEEQARQPGETG